MTSLDTLKRRAKALRKAYAAGEAEAVARVRAVMDAQALTHADALHVVAREEGAESWPKLKFALEAAQMDRAAKADRLRLALYHGQHWVVEALLSNTPDLRQADFGLACALYDLDRVRAVLARDASAATRAVRGRRPICHLAFSQHIHGGGSEAAMLGVAEALAQAGADPNDRYDFNGDPNSPLSALYGALGHGNNMALAGWLLGKGADPDDGESLYHATELGHYEGLQLLFDHGVSVAGTNALPRALDFDDPVMVRMLLAAGADPNEGVAPHASGEPAFVIPALHQAARRMCQPGIVADLLTAGADASARYEGILPYAMARVYGNQAAARLIAEAGGDMTLTPEEALLAQAAEGEVPNGRYLDPSKLPEEYRVLLRAILAMPGKRGHVERLVAIGAEWDRPDPMGLTPVQIAGWEGLPDMLAYFLRLKPDLSHINGYGGTLLSTIVHGSENCPKRAERDHIACARLALAEGVALPRRAAEFAGVPEMAQFLAAWAEAHPGQVVETGPV